MFTASVEVGLPAAPIPNIGSAWLKAEMLSMGSNARIESQRFDREAPNGGYCTV